MGRADHLELGDWNAVCSLCGFKRKASTMVKNWQGLYRCPEHNEPRQPQDFVRGVQDVQTVPWAQPPTKIYIEFCSLELSSATPGYAGPGCMVPGRSYYPSPGGKGGGSGPVPPPISVPGAPTGVTAT